jgi:serine/threonine protein phosphatase 1
VPIAPRQSEDFAPLNAFISDWEQGPARLPEGVRVWAIGDVHGHLRHFETLLTAVRARVAVAPAGPKHVVVLGDTIDRGADSIAALHRAANLDIPGVTTTALWGNHEEYLQTFLSDPGADDEFLRFWQANGGVATLDNLWINPADISSRPAAEIIAEGRRLASPSVHESLSKLKMGLKIGDYLFVHAGVHPRHGLDDEDIQRLTTMREPFLTGEHWSHDFAVVHGHSIVGPDVFPHRISVDSGAYYTGVLTCVELHGDQARFLCVSPDRDLDALRKIRKRRPLSSETWRRLSP